MPGFGYGPFGHEPFGEWKWSKQVLFDLLPQLYKAEDEVQGGVLESYSEGLRPSFDGLRHRILDYDQLRDPLEIRTANTEVSVIRLGKNIPVRGVVEQRGIDGVVENVTRNFISPTARFTAFDVGKELTLVDSSIPSNRFPVRIASIVNINAVTTNPILISEAGPVRWELRAFTPAVDYAQLEVAAGDASIIAPGWQLTDGSGILEIFSRSQFIDPAANVRLLTESEGADGSADSSGDFFATTAAFVPRDVGKKLTISGSNIALNNTKQEIRRVLGASTVSLSYVQIRGEDSTGGIGYSSFGDIGGVTPTIQHLVAGLNTVLSVSVSGAAVTVNIATNASGEPISIASVVVALVNSDPLAKKILFAQPDDGVGSGRVLGSNVLSVEGRLLTPDVGPLEWAVLSRPIIQTLTRAIPRGVVEREGTDLLIVASAQSSKVSAASSKVDSTDIGKILSVRGSGLGNDGVFVIDSILSPTSFTVAERLTVEAAPLFWEIRAATGLDDVTSVKANAPSLIPFLGSDFGVNIDLQETDERQRANVASVTKWTNKKGNFDSYRILGLLSGFNVTTVQLFRLGQDLFSVIPSGDSFEVGEADLGRSGPDGSLVAGSAGRVRFIAPSAQFVSSDVGEQIAIQGAATPSNNNFYTIDIFIDAHTVEFRLVDIAVVPDANNGAPVGLRWGVVRLYTDLPPLLPSMDDMNTDAITSYEIDLTGSPEFEMDKFCWESDWSSTMETNVLSVVSTTPTDHTVTVPRGPFPIADILTIIPDPGIPGDLPGVFQFTDSAGTVYFLESFPVDAGGGNASFTVFATLPPALGSATVAYVCQPQDFGCGYCSASVAYAKIEAGTIAGDSGIATENVLERMLMKLQLEAKPAHVTLVPSFQQTIQASLFLSASGLMDVALIAPFSMSGVGHMAVTAVNYQVGEVLFLGEGDLAASATLNIGAAAAPLGSGDMLVDAEVF